MASDKPDRKVLNDASQSKRLIWHIGQCLNKYWEDYEEWPKELRMRSKSCALLFHELGFAEVSEEKPFPIGKDGKEIKTYNSIPIIITEKT